MNTGQKNLVDITDNINLMKGDRTMAALYGRLKGNLGVVTRMGSNDSGIWAKLETWEGSVTVYLQANGDFAVKIGEKRWPDISVVGGNVDDKTFKVSKG